MRMGGRGLAGGLTYQITGPSLRWEGTRNTLWLIQCGCIASLGFERMERSLQAF